MQVTRLPASILFSLLSGTGSAQTTTMDFSPDGYLSEKFAQSPSAANSGVAVSEIDIGGDLYTRYSHESGTLYVQKMKRPDADPEVFLSCKSYLNNPKELVEHRLSLEKEITESVSVDLTLVSDVIISRCDGRIHGMSPSINPLEIGVRIKNKDGSSYRIFNRMLKPNLGIHTEF